MRRALLLALAPLAAGAHPHGALDCSVQAQAHEGQVPALVLALTLDTSSSAQLQGRVRADDTDPSRETRAFRSLLAGLFRQSAWMLHARADGQARAVDWTDPDEPSWAWRPEGRLQMQVRLQPAGGPLPLAGLELRCQDSSWYWLARYRTADAVRIDGAPCRVELDDWQVAADRAREQQAQAQRAGAIGADLMAPGLAEDGSRGAATARLRC
jgi:ABC-type uncharacterized transport system substrate-binding protein